MWVPRFLDDPPHCDREQYHWSSAARAAPSSHPRLVTLGIALHQLATWGAVSKQCCGLVQGMVTCWRVLCKELWNAGSCVLFDGVLCCLVQSKLWACANEYGRIDCVWGWSLLAPQQVCPKSMVASKEVAKLQCQAQLDETAVVPGIFPSVDCSLSRLMSWVSYCSACCHHLMCVGS